MENQTTQKKEQTYEDKLARDRDGMDFSMPDVEVVSNEPVEVEEPQQAEEEVKDYKTPSVLTAEGDESETSFATDWESESRKFQSMYDKQKADYDSLQQQVQALEPLKQLQSVLEARPDIVQLMQERLEGKPAQENNKSSSTPDGIDEASFDPWEAYYKPDSPSYKLRVSQEKALVSEAVQEQMAGIQSQVAMQNLKNELRNNYGISDEKEMEDFIQFATNPREQLPVDFLINVFRQYKNKDNPQPMDSENLEAVKNIQSMPKSAGVLQGGDPKQKSELDVSWDRILKAGNAGRLA